MESKIFRGEFLGVPVDVEIKSEVRDGICHQTIECALPHVQWSPEQQCLIVWPPPLRPSVTDSERLEMELIRLTGLLTADKKPMK